MASGRARRELTLLLLLVGVLTVHVRGGSVGVGRPAVSICSGVVLGDVTDTSLRRVVVKMGGSVVNIGRLIVPVSGSAVGVGGALTGFLDVLRRESGIVLRDRFATFQRHAEITQLLGPSRRPVRRVGHG